MKAGKLEMTGSLDIPASNVTEAGLNIKEGVAPSSPIDGDVWVTAAGAFNARLNGVTVDLSTGPTDEKSFNSAGTLQTYVGVARWYPIRDIAISEIRANVGIPSTGQDILININKNGAPVVSNLTIGQTLYLSALDTTIITLTTSDYMTIDVTQIGTGAAGQDLTINLKYK